MGGMKGATKATRKFVEREGFSPLVVVIVGIGVMALILIWLLAGPWA
jgi:hypothetical protein